jgi:hypothetical protein
MNTEDLKRIVEEEGFIRRVYSIDGDYLDNQLVLKKEGTVWAVFYYERGARWNERLFNTEDEACNNFLERLRRDRSARRGK